MLEEILKAESPLTFERYMKLCLYHERYGYYARGPRLGRKGDYFTSPTVHRVFGAALAVQVLEIYERLGEPPDFKIVEAGAGEGYLALDLLTYLKKKDRLFPYTILEPFPALKSLQEETLKDFEPWVNWRSGPEELKPWVGVFIANELLDAFPVHLITKTPEGLQEIYVKVTEEGLEEETGALSEPEILSRVLPFALTWPEGYRTEVCTSLEPFYKELAKKLFKGAFIFIDYGFPRPDYYHPERSRGTLLAYYRHRPGENPYLRPGHQDLTAHVDFTYLRELGERYGLLNLGFTQQGPFLVSLGVERLLEEVSACDFRDREALKLLLLPEGLGHSHWVLVQGRGFDLHGPPLKGFTLSNRLRLL